MARVFEVWRTNPETFKDEYYGVYEFLDTAWEAIKQNWSDMDGEKFSIVERISDFDVKDKNEEVDTSVTPQEPTDKKFTKADIDAIVKAINTGLELRVNEILNKIRVDIFKYEGDCRLSVDEYPSCEQCTASVFTTIYKILDKYKLESEE